MKENQPGQSTVHPSVFSHPNPSRSYVAIVISLVSFGVVVDSSRRFATFLPHARKKEKALLTPEEKKGNRRPK